MLTNVDAMTCVRHYSDCYPDYLSICKNGQPSKSISQVPTPDEQSATDLIHSIDLSKGENMIGYPLNEEIPVEKLNNYCPLEYSDGYYFWTYEGDTDSWVPAEKLQPRKAYRVNSKEDCSLFLIGAGANFEKLSLSKGWNLITSPKLSIFNNVLGTCKGKLDDEHNVIGFDEETKNQVQKNLLEPNKAYWVFAKSECELDFSSNKPPYTTEGQIKEMSFSSNALKENRKYNVYLPPNYYTSSSRYPVLYLFHGAGGDHNIWIKKGKIDEHIKNLFQDGQITEIILVMPDDDQSALENGCSGLGVDIKNPKDVAQRACGNYEDFIVNDLIPHIDSTYRTIADKSARGFLGFSTGAHGAYWIAFRHPQLVSFVAGYSGYYQEKSFISGPLQYTSIDDYRSFRKVEIPPKDEISHMTLYLEVGKYDVVAGAGKQNEKFHERLKKAGIPHTYLVTPAGINQIYVHGEGFLRDNMDKAIVLFSKDIAEPIKLVQYKVP
jgi:enterochelin esterase-like enzyme